MSEGDPEVLLHWKDNNSRETERPLQEEEKIENI